MRPTVLTIGGFDPCGGAGVLADIKTLEQHKVYGLSLITCNTLQSENEFHSVDWMDTTNLNEQLQWMLERYSISYVKIGLIKDQDSLNSVSSLCKEKKIPVIWDPVLNTSSGYSFHQNIDAEQISQTANNLFVITPNWEEIKVLSGIENSEVGAEQLAKHCHIFLKGGHRSDKAGYDILFTREGKHQSFKPKKSDLKSKHGSGCVLSSSLAANLALGYSLPKACLKAKDYTAKFLKSNKSLTGYHKR